MSDFFDLTEIFLQSHFVAFIVGVMSSAAVWYVTSHLIGPKIEFSKFISLDCSPDGAIYNQVVFKNVGRREILDLTVFVRIGVENLKGNQIWAHQNLRSNGSSIPSLKKNEHRRVYVFDERNDIEFLDTPAKPFGDALRSCSKLSDVLILGDDAEITVHVFGYDKLSGTRKHFASKPYRLIDVKKGTFDGIELCND